MCKHPNSLHAGRPVLSEGRLLQEALYGGYPREDTLTQNSNGSVELHTSYTAGEWQYFDSSCVVIEKTTFLTADMQLH